MARTIEEIYNGLIAKKQSFTQLADLSPQYLPGDNPYQMQLDDLSTSSQVGIWRLFLYLIACGHYTMEVIMDVFKSEAEDISRRNIFGTEAWYYDKMFAFQYGYLPIWNSADYTYAYSDTTSPTAVDARIIKKVSVKEEKTSAYNTVLIKLAKESAPNVLIPLDPGELTAADSYIDRLKPPGIKTQLISLPADEMRQNLTIKYDGTLDVADFETKVVETIETYLKAFSGNDFDGTFNVDDFVVYMKKNVQGLINIFVNEIAVKAYYDLSFSIMTNSYNPASGYFSLVPIGITGSDSQITYIAL
jgi:hypothetical protein